MSMSVRNRAAMFEPGKKEETPPSPSNKFPRRSSGNGAQGGQRASWPWPTEENVIPVPKPQDAKRGAPRRISSPFLQPQTRPTNGLPPHLSPKAGGGPVSNSPFKHLQNKAAGVSSPRFGSSSVSSPRATPPVPGFKKTTSPVVSSPVAQPIDENNRPITRANSFGASAKSAEEKVKPPVGPSMLSKKDTTPVDVALSQPVILPMDKVKPPVGPTTVSKKDTTPVDAALSQPVILPLDPRTRAMQLAKTKNNRAVQESKAAIEISKTATDDEKSSDGSSDASTNKELANIADQAMALAQNESTVSNTIEARDDCASVASISTMRTSRSERLSQALRKTDGVEVDNASLAPTRSQSPLRPVRGSRTISNVSHQQARKALLEAAQKKKERVLEQPRPKEDSVQEKESIDNQAQAKKSNEGGAANRLAFKAANVLALKNTTKILAQGPTTGEKDLSMPCSSSCSIVSSHSVDSVGKRRKDHPAFAKMSPRFPVPPAEFGGSGKQGANDPSTPKPFSEELFSSFRHFKEYRPEAVNGAGTGPSFDRSTPISDLAMTFSDNSVPVPPHLDTVEPSKSAAGRPPSGSTPISARSPKTLREALAEGKSSVCQSFDYNQFSPANGNGNVGHLSVDSEDIEPEESLHSTSARNFDPFYATGQPRYASARQSFNQQEGGYVSSLSSHTFTVQSMISTGNEPSALMVKVGTEGPNALGDLASARSTGPSMSGRSLAHSIISVSPTACAPNLSAEFENALRAQKESGKELTQIFRPVVPDEGTDALQAVAMSTFDPDEEGSGPTLGFSVDDSTEEPTVGPSVEGIPESEGPMATGSDAKSLMNEIVETILPSRSSNTGSDAPPGFVFRDSETEEEYPVANQSSSEDRDNDASKAETRETNNDASTEGYSMRDDLFRVDSEHSFDEESFGKELKKGGLKADAALVFGADVVPSKDSTEPSKISVKVSDEKETSKSHRSAFSPKEGSSSIRTGLSAIQNPLSSDLEGSASMRSTTQHGVDRGETREVDASKLPDTIHEADDEDGTTTKGGSKAPSTLGFQSSGTGPSSTYSSQTSSGASGTRGSSGSSALSSQQTDSVSEPPVKFPAAFRPSQLTQLNTHPEKTEEEISAVSSPSSSRHSRWKMKMPTVLKNVLAKASPRHTPAQTPTSVSEARGKGSEAAKTDLDDDDDIFGGLEDEVSRMFNEPVKRTPVARIETKSTTKNVKQVRGRFFSSGQNRKTPDNNNTGRSEARTTAVSNTTPTTTPMMESGKANASPIAAKINPLTPNYDRSGTTVVETEVENVNSDITSSILGHPATANVGSTPRARPPTKAPTSLETELKAFDKTPKAKTRKSPKSVKSNNSKSRSTRSRSKSTGETRRRVEVEDYESEDVDADHDDADVSYPEGKVESSEESTSRPDSVPGSMFMNLGCGLTDAFSAVAGVCHFGSKTAEDEEELEKSSIQEILDDEVVLKSSDSNNTSSRLTDLEKRVWHEWDKLESAFNTKAGDPAAQDEMDDHDRKREVARGKLLEIASSALSSQMTKEGEHSYTSGTTSTDSGDDSGMSRSSASRTATSSESQTLGSNSDMGSDALSADKGTSAVTPMLLSFSQRSLIEKFTKQLTNVGVEVLKLNRRKQWQIRYFTVSKEHTALVAHEAKTKSNGDVARCPKALLWLKKFNSKSGGYGVSNIDKNGHGGMMLVDLMDIRVSLKVDEENPIPKKLADKFKESALVTLEYQMNGENRSIEFRCKDNDEAQFLCTCMRVIRDLLKREQTLRQSMPVTPKKA